MIYIFKSRNNQLDTYLFIIDLFKISEFLTIISFGIDQEVRYLISIRMNMRHNRLLKFYFLVLRNNNSI